jgi:anti-anti-sigma factor
MDTTKSIEAEKEISTKLQTVTQLTPVDQLHIVFDLGDVDYIASAFIRICLQTAKTTSGKFSVQKTNPFVMKIFMMTGLDKEQTFLD